MMPNVREVENLADGWAHDNLDSEHYTPRDEVYRLAVEAYTAGYEQAWADAREVLS